MKPSGQRNVSISLLGWNIHLQMWDSPSLSVSTMRMKKAVCFRSFNPKMVEPLSTPGTVGQNHPLLMMDIQQSENQTFVLLSHSSFGVAMVVAHYQPLLIKIDAQTLLHCWWECELIQPLWRTVWTFLKKLKIELPYDPAIPLLGIHPEKTIIQRESCTKMFICWWKLRLLPCPGYCK